VGLWLTQTPNSRLLTELSTKAPDVKPAWERSVALAALANAQLSTGSVVQATQTAEQALLAAPSSAIAQWIGGKAFAQNKRESEAVLAFRRAIQLEPAWAEPHLLLADSLAKNPDTLKEAVDSYKSFIKHSKDENAKKLAQKKLEALRQ
jgi:Flp pilus assembly protein TadD